MKHLFKLFVFFVAFTTTTNAQIFTPVKWETTTEKISDTEFDLIITATIDKGWHLYSKNVPEDGPIPTTISFEEDKNTYQLKGNITEGKGHEEYDNVFLRAIDTGGVVWESDKVYKNLDDAFADLEAGIKKWCQETL